MIHQQGTKVARAIDPVVIDDATGTAVAIDCAGYAHAEVVLYVGATDIALTALSLTECDTSGGTYTPVTGTVVGTDNTIAGAASALPSATDDSKFWIFDVDCRKRKRFLKLTCTADDGTVGAAVAALAILSVGQVTPFTAADRGAAEILRV